MKIRIVLVYLLSSMGQSLLAQDIEDNDRREKFTAGVRAGVNYSNVWDASGQDFEADGKFGFAGGIFASIPIGRYFGIQPEINYSQKGLKASGTLFGTGYEYRKTTSFIDIPMQFQIKPFSFLSFLVGPQVSFLVYEKNEYTYGSNSTIQEEAFKNENVRKNILGIVTGFDINIDHFVFSGRVAWDLQSNKGDGSSSTPRYRNQFVQLTIGIRL